MIFSSRCKSSVIQLLSLYMSLVAKKAVPMQELH